MIPPFTDNGVLPEGVHLATLEEIATRFGMGTQLRRDQMESVRWTVALARRAGAIRLAINGSFTTDAPQPNDVDCVMLLSPPGKRDASAVAELEAGIPFVDLSIVTPVEFQHFLDAFFAYDRMRTPKGIIEVIL